MNFFTNASIFQAKLDVNLEKMDDLRLKPVGTVNLLERVNNSDSSDSMDEDTDSYEDRTPGAKLRQLLDTNSRSGAVVAG